MMRFFPEVQIETRRHQIVINRRWCQLYSDSSAGRNRPGAYLVKGNIMRKIAHSVCENSGRFRADCSAGRPPGIDACMPGIVRRQLNGLTCFSFYPLLFHSI